MNAYDRFLRSDYKVYANGSPKPLSPTESWHQLHYQSTVFIRGLPGAGKTTFAKHVFPRWPRFEADDWIDTTDDKQHRHNLCQWDIDEHLNKHFLTVVCNTFTRHWEIESYRLVTLPNTDEPTIVHVHHGLLTDADLSRRTRYHVPEHDIMIMRLRWQPWPGELIVRHRPISTTDNGQFVPAHRAQA